MGWCAPVAAPPSSLPRSLPAAPPAALRRRGRPLSAQTLAGMRLRRWPKDFLTRSVVLTATYTVRFHSSTPPPLLLPSSAASPAPHSTPLPTPPQSAFVVFPFLMILLSRPGSMPWSKGQFVLFVTFWASVAGSTVCLLLQVRAAGEGTSSPFLVKTNKYCYQQARCAAQKGAEREFSHVTVSTPPPPMWPMRARD